ATPAIYTLSLTTLFRSGRLDGARREDAKDLPLDRFIHAEPTEGDAAPRAMIDVSTAATVPRDVAFGAGVRHVEAAPTAAAAEETDRKSTRLNSSHVAIS